MLAAPFRICGDSANTELTISVADVTIAAYVYRPDTPLRESPKPYLYPLRSLSGAPLAVFRPWDHRWHRGLQMTWSHLSGQNFWGGPSYDRSADGYIWRENHGRQQHRGFDRLDTESGDASISERLDWIASSGEVWLHETRTLRFHGADPNRGLWILDFDTALANTRADALRMGSPTTHGRPNAGYTGLFWRGPRAWTGAAVIADGADEEEVMGFTGAWAAISSENDESDGGATVLAYLGTSSASVPLKWFSRSEPFAGLNPSPAFDTEIRLEPGEALHLRHRFVFIDQVTDRSTLEPLAAEFAL